MITNEQRKEKLQSVDDKIKEMYGSMQLAEIIKANSVYTQQDTHPLFVDLVGDIILGFHTTSELPTLLQKELGVSADDAQKITKDLSEFLAPIIAKETSEKNIKKEELHELEQSLSAQRKKDVSVTPSTSEKISTPTSAPPTPTEISQVQPMRTMEGDINRIHGYGAYRAQFPDQGQEATHTEEVIRKATQEDILKEKPKLTEKPNYTEE